MADKPLKPNLDKVLEGLETVADLLRQEEDPNKKIGKLTLELTDLAGDFSCRGRHINVRVNYAVMKILPGESVLGKEVYLEGIDSTRHYFLDYDPITEKYRQVRPPSV